jgi:protein SCO1/2
MPLRIVLRLLVGGVVVGVGGGFAAHALSSARAAPRLPALHGQAIWKAGSRPAPRLALRDERGRLLSLRSLRGRTVALTFLDSRCRSRCPLAGRQLAWAVRGLPAAERPTLLVVSVNPAGDTPRSVRAAARRWGFTGSWHWLLGSRPELAPVWKAYGVSVLPQAGDTVHSLAVYLIDRHGDERTGYLFPFLPAFVRGDLATLARGSAA